MRLQNPARNVGSPELSDTDTHWGGFFGLPIHSRHGNLMIEHNDRENVQRKTKTVVTIGPASAASETLRQLMAAGMDVARINSSHASLEEMTDLVQRLREVEKQAGSMLCILLDLSGPKIRVDNIPPEGTMLTDGDEFTLGSDSKADVRIRPQIGFQVVEDHARVMLDDGRIELQVLARESSSRLRVRVTFGGKLRANKGVNFPGVALAVPSLTSADKEFLRHGLALGVDWVALSFVRSPDDRKPIDAIFSAAGKQLPVMAKIEKPEAVARLKEIVQAFDGIMVARGDLGVEMPLEEVPHIQKKIIRACNSVGKPVVTATQLLDSMISSPAPTRAEVNDVANAIYDGTDALMLSNETAVGSYPVKVVQTLSTIALATERETAGTMGRRRVDYSLLGVGASISHAASTIAREREIPVVVTMTHSGNTARHVARYRPKSRIVALSPHLSTCRQLQLSWGVTPVHVKSYGSTDEMLAESEKLLLVKGFVRPGEYFVLTAGVPIGQSGTTNLLKVQKVGAG